MTTMSTAAIITTMTMTTTTRSTSTHHHHDGEECDDPHCGCHHHHHHADEVFTSWGVETVKTFTESGSGAYPVRPGRRRIRRDPPGQGHRPAADGGQWLHFDFVPEEHQVRRGPADYTGRLCVIGAELKEDKLAELFGL